MQRITDPLLDNRTPFSAARYSCVRRLPSLGVRGLPPPPLGIFLFCPPHGPMSFLD